MKYAKLIDGKPEYSPNPIKIGVYTVYNPTDNMLLNEGYLPVTYTNPPCEPDSGYMWVEKWYELEDTIYQAWEQVLEPDEVNSERAMEILFGGECD